MNPPPRELTNDEIIAFYYEAIRSRDDLMLPEAVRTRAMAQALALSARGRTVMVQEVDGTLNYWIADKNEGGS